jgi:hypothetical protein
MSVGAGRDCTRLIADDDDDDNSDDDYDGYDDDRIYLTAIG